MTVVVLLFGCLFSQKKYICVLDKELGHLNIVKKVFITSVTIMVFK